MKRLSSVRTPVFIALLLFYSILMAAQSDSEKATALAKKVEMAMGGIDNYNNTHFIKWDFGKRTLYWDKWTGNVRIESPDKNLVILVNINTLSGKVFENGTLVTSKEKNEKLLTQAKNWWINDSYWLVMPWKLQDPGVTLTYVGTDSLTNGNKADVLQMTFDSVGNTPNNKYLVYIDQEDHLIKQWQFFKNFNDAEPKFSRPWDNYKKMGDILLSFNRSEFGPTNVEVRQEFSAEIFNNI